MPEKSGRTKGERTGTIETHVSDQGHCGGDCHCRKETRCGECGYDLAGFDPAPTHCPNCKVKTLWGVPDEHSGETATIDSIVTDQGNGGSYCSGCDAPIDLDKDDLEKCKHCGRKLVWGEVSVNEGGSDF